MSSGPNTPQVGEWVRWEAPDTPSVPPALRRRTVYGVVINADLVSPINDRAMVVVREGHPHQGHALTTGWILQVPVDEVERGRWDWPPPRDVAWVPA